MTSPITVGLGAGLASALLFLSVATGTALAFVLYVLLPLPALIAGVGWGMKAAVVCLASASLVVGLAGGLGAEASYLVAYGLPLLALTWVALSGRPRAADAGAPQALAEPGRILAAATLLAGAFAGFLVLTLGRNRATYDAAVKGFGAQFATALPEWLRDGVDPGELDRALGDLSASLPAALAATWLAVVVLNLLIARRVLARSGRLALPLHGLAQTDAPLVLLLTFLASVALSFDGGIAGTIAHGFTGAHIAAFALIGLGVVHALARGRSGAPVILGAAYGALILLPPVAAGALVLLALAESVLRLRERRAATLNIDPSEPRE